MALIYQLEFDIIPKEFEKKGSQIFLDLIKNKEYFYNLFNKYYKMLGKIIKFKKRDFGMYDFDLGEGYHVIYAALPRPSKLDMPNVYCTAYCIPYKLYNDSIEIEGLYNIEMSIFGTNCIGQNIDGKHFNLGPIAQTLKETVAKVGNIAFGKNFKIN